MSTKKCPADCCRDERTVRGFMTQRAMALIACQFPLAEMDFFIWKTQ